MPVIAPRASFYDIARVLSLTKITSPSQLLMHNQTALLILIHLLALLILGTPLLTRGISLRGSLGSHLSQLKLISSVLFLNLVVAISLIFGSLLSVNSALKLSTSVVLRVVLRRL